MRPSQRLNTYIDTIRDEAVPHSVLILALEAMRDQFQKEEAQYYKNLQASNKYNVLNRLIEKSDELTGR